MHTPLRPNLKHFCPKRHRPARVDQLQQHTARAWIAEPYATFGSI